MREKNNIDNAVLEAIKRHSKIQGSFGATDIIIVETPEVDYLEAPRKKWVEIRYESNLG